MCSMYKPLACNIREGKWILVFINGDTYNEGTWVLVNPTHIRNFAKLLAHLTDKLNPIFGAVRSLVALRDGWPITVNSLDSIRPNEKYVAIGSEKFKPLRYLTKQEKEHKSFRKVHYNVGEQYCQLSVRCKKDTHISIYLFTNGDRSLQPYKFVLTQNNLASWGSTLELMARRMTASPRGIQYLYTVHGEIVCGPWELQNGAMYVAVGYKESFVNLDYCITPTEMSRSVREGKPLQKGKFCMGPVGQPVGGRITGPCVHVNRAGVMKKNNRGCHSLMKCAKRQDKDSLPLTSSLWCCEVEHEAEGSLPVTSLSELMCSPASAISLGVCNKNVSSTKTHQDSREFSRKAQNNQHILYLPTCRGPLKICVRPATNLCNKEESSDLQYACGESPRKSPEKMHILHITTSSSDSSFHSNSNSNSLNCHEKPKCPVCHHKKKPFIYKVTKMLVSKGPAVKVDYDKDHGGVYRARKFRSSSVSSVEECGDTLVELPIEMLEPEQVPEQLVKEGAQSFISLTDD